MSSRVWDYFTIIESDDKKATCNSCNAQINRGHGKKTSTSSLWKHLKFKHPDLLPSTSTSQKGTTTNVVLKQALINSYTAKKKWPFESKKSMEIHKAIGEMIALDNQPFTIVSDKGFQRLIEILEPEYHLLGRTYFSEKVIPMLFEQCQKKIFQLIANVEAISLTTDMWTSEVNNKSFISLTAHWIDSKFEFKRVVLNIRGFEGTHSADNIKSTLLSLLSENGISHEKIHLLLRDSGANIKRAAKDMEVKNKSCFIHTLQLIVLDSLKSQRAVSDMISKSRSIVTHFNHSSPSRKKLEDIQKELNMPPKKMIQDIQTRWNSTYYLLERLYEQKRPISLLSAETNAIPTLSQNQWLLLENVLLLLKPFEEATRHFSSMTSIISEVIPTILSVKRYLSQSNVAGVGTMQDTLVNGLNNRFLDIEDDNNYTFATLLDPRFKCAFFTNIKIENIKQELTNYITKIIEKKETNNTSSKDKKLQDDDSSDDSDDAPLSTLTQEEPPQKKAKTSIWDIFSDIAEVGTSNCQNTCDPEKIVQTEIDNYTKYPLVPRDTSPFSWWQLNNCTFPNLAKAAKIFLSAPGTSVSSERLFSEAGNVFDEKRNRLNSERGEQLIFLHDNLPLLDFNY